MNEIQLINWLSTKCYFTIRNSFSGAFMVPELVVFYIDAEIRLKRGVFKFHCSSKVDLYYALEEMKSLIEKWYQNNAPEYL